MSADRSPGRPTARRRRRGDATWRCTGRPTAALARRRRGGHRWRRGALRHDPAGLPADAARATSRSSRATSRCGSTAADRARCRSCSRASSRSRQYDADGDAARRDRRADPRRARRPLRRRRRPRAARRRPWQGRRPTLPPLGADRPVGVAAERWAPAPTGDPARHRRDVATRPTAPGRVDRARRWTGDEYRWRGRGLRADDRRGRDEPGHRPVLGRAHDATRPRSVVVDLDDQALAPDAVGRRRQRPVVAAPVDRAIYELHVRDFSISDETVPGGASAAPTCAFTAATATGMRAPARARRRRASTPCTCCRRSTSPRSRRTAPRRQTPACDLASLRRPTRPSSRRASTAIARRGRLQLGLRPAALHGARGLLRDRPRTAARRVARVPRDGRGAATATGLRVVHRRGLQPHRRRPARTPSRCSTGSCPATTTGSTRRGSVETSTCCPNTATEHAMMEKLMVDSVRHLGAASTRSTASAST